MGFALSAELLTRFLMHYHRARHCEGAGSFVLHDASLIAPEHTHRRTV